MLPSSSTLRSGRTVTNTRTDPLLESTRSSFSALSPSSSVGSQQSSTGSIPMLTRERLRFKSSKIWVVSYKSGSDRFLHRSSSLLVRRSSLGSALISIDFCFHSLHWNPLSNSDNTLNFRLAAALQLSYQNAVVSLLQLVSVRPSRPLSSLSPFFYNRPSFIALSCLPLNILSPPRPSSWLPPSRRLSRQCRSWRSSKSEQVNFRRQDFSPAT